MSKPIEGDQSFVFGPDLYRTPQESLCGNIDILPQWSSQFAFHERNVFVDVIGFNGKQCENNRTRLGFVDS